MRFSTRWRNSRIDSFANSRKSKKLAEEHSVQLSSTEGDMNRALQLLKRYNEATPRYTSYPPVPHWHAAREGLLISALRRSRAPLSIYVHIPFCERLCLYCGCNVVVRKDHSHADAYLKRLDEEMEL